MRIVLMILLLAWAVSGRLAEAQSTEVAVDLIEDEPVLVTSVSADSVWLIQGARTVSAGVEDGAVRIVPFPDSTGRFAIGYRDRDSRRAGRIHGEVLPRTDVRIGRIEDFATRRPRAGAVRVLTPEGALLAESWSDASGRVRDVQLSQTRTGYVLQVGFPSDTSFTGYVNTGRIAPPAAGADIVLPVVRALSHPAFDDTLITPETFRDHVLEVTQGKIRRWDSARMAGIYIVTQGPDGRFSGQEIEDIRAALGETCAAQIAPGLDFRILTGSGSEAPVSWAARERPRANDGWLVIIPDTDINAPGVSQSEDVDNDGIYDRGVILLNPEQAGRMGNWPRFLCREIVRALAMPGTAGILPFYHTIVAPGIGPDVPARPTEVDRIVGSVVYDPTVAPGTEVEAVLGEGWE